MPNRLESAAGEARAAAGSLADHGQKAIADVAAVAERSISEAARTAERALREGLDAIRSHAKTYTEEASDNVDVAQRYVMKRVKERPVTATLTGLGIGLLIGLLLSNRPK
jgi:ElaB/YqjD/DUF883 family membrane-anchored ribosome-binding protein